MISYNCRPPKCPTPLLAFINNPCVTFSGLVPRIIGRTIKLHLSYLTKLVYSLKSNNLSRALEIVMTKRKNWTFIGAKINLYYNRCMDSLTDWRIEILRYFKKCWSLEHFNTHRSRRRTDSKNKKPQHFGYKDIEKFVLFSITCKKLSKWADNPPARCYRRITSL